MIMYCDKMTARQIDAPSPSAVFAQSVLFELPRNAETRDCLQRQSAPLNVSVNLEVLRYRALGDYDFMIFVLYLPTGRLNENSSPISVLAGHSAQKHASSLLSLAKPAAAAKNSAPLRNCTT